MPRIPANQIAQEPPMQDGDERFLGVNMRLDPGQLAPGYVAKAVNMRFNRGVAEPRRGIKKMAWTNKVDNAVAHTIVPFTSVHGAEVFSDPNRVEWALIAAEGKVYKTTQCNGASLVPIPAGVVLTGTVSFTQCFNQVVLWRGEGLTPLVLSDIDEGFKSIALSTASAEGISPGTEVIPNAASGEFFQNRLLVPHDKDQVAVSDFLDYTRYSPTLNSFRINQGSSDSLVRLFKFNDTSVLVLKSRSIYVVSNLVPDGNGTYAGAVLDQLTNQYGCAAARSVVAVGSDVVFLSERGVVSVRQTEQNKLQSVDLPLSDPIQPLIDRINWSFASGACAAYHNNRLFLSVPLDGAKANNSVLVYDYLNQAWSGYDSNMPVLQWLKLNYGGVLRLFFLGTDGYLNLYEEGFSDDLQNDAGYTYLDLTVTAGAAGSSLYGAEDYIKFQGDDGAFADNEDSFNHYDSLVDEHRWWGVKPTSDVMPLQDLLERMTSNLYNGYLSLWSMGDAGGTGAGIVLLNSTTIRFCPGTGKFLNVALAGAWYSVAYAYGIMRRDIQTELVTRGYYCTSNDPKRFRWVTVNIATWHPTCSINVLTEGAYSSTACIASLTTNRAKYLRPYGKADFVLNNSNDDYQAPDREDYSLSLSAAQSLFMGSNGIQPDQHQATTRRRSVRARGVYAQVQILGTGGRTVLSAVRVEALHGQAHMGNH